jgi:4-hydroxy 2-oxovalerate aldolase
MRASAASDKYLSGRCQLKENLRILDCTLRDGGFVNDWRFGEAVILNIFERLCLSKSDIIELGYLRDYIDFDVNATQYSRTDDINRIISTKPSFFEGMLVAIIDYGNCTIENISDASTNALDGIRVTFKKTEIPEALAFGKQIKEKGYKLFLQPVSIMDYNDRDILDLIDAANDIDPFALCIVDTYGFMHKKDLIRYWSLMNDNLKETVCVGYHAHNNFQLGYANAIELLEINTPRTIIIDCSAFGMGKGAGNTNTELLMLYLNENFGKEYNVDQILEIIDTYLNQERQKTIWGYSLLYYLAAYNDCHHQYIRTLINKKTLSVSSINEIIATIDSTKKTKFDGIHLEQKYLEYQSHEIDDKKDIKRLGSLLAGREILLVAPGVSVKAEALAIREFIQKHNPYIIGINHLPKILPADMVFIGNAKRYGILSLLIKNSDYKEKGGLIALTSNITQTQLRGDFILNYAKLVDDGFDSSAIMLLEALIRAGVKDVKVAGLDGYSSEELQHVDDIHSTNKSIDVAAKNKRNGTALAKKQVSITINLLTPSYYSEYMD